MNFRLYNTLTKRIEAVIPVDPGRITFYTCGPTVYDDAHIGNFRSFLAADLLRRWLESPLCTVEANGVSYPGPRRVVHVMNITDVGHMTDDTAADGGGEDKMVVAADRIRAAKKAGTIPSGVAIDPDDPIAVASFYKHRFLEDARALGLKVAIEAADDPTLMPCATGHIQGMVRVIRVLLERGFAYGAGDAGSRAIYFDVARAATYGELSGNTLDQLRGGAGGRVDAGNQSQKRHPADFMLWKEDAAHKMKWDSPIDGWAKGYPGWHIECTAMALARLVPGGLDAASGEGEPPGTCPAVGQIDFHSGGEDNIFPHHECEIAQSCAFTGGERFARHWFHPRFLMVDGKKMSKSKGTFFTPRELMAKGIEPAAIRLELIKTHYRANADFSMQGLKDSGNRIKKWRKLAGSLHNAVEHDRNSPVPNFDTWVAKFVGAMLQDLNIAGALSALDIASGTINIDIGSRQPSEPFLESDRGSVPYPIPETPYSHDQIDELLASGGEARKHLAMLHQVDLVLGVIFQPAHAASQSQETGVAVYLPGAEPSDEVEALLVERRDAKKSKNFAASDAIRDRLREMGYAIKDMPGGRVEVGPA